MIVFCSTPTHSTLNLKQDEIMTESDHRQVVTVDNETEPLQKGSNAKKRLKNY